MSNFSIAVYTCFFGTSDNWANIVLPAPFEDIPCYYFTNNRQTYDSLSGTGWTGVFVKDVPVSEDARVCAAQTKHLRCCPHDYPLLRPYAYLCWMDSKLKVTSREAFNEMVQGLADSPSVVWAFTRHPLPYTSVWDEYKEAVQHEKYAFETDRYRAYIESRLKAGYVEDLPQLVCCGFSIRKACPLVEEIGEFWHREIQECGIEDQISFQFVHQLYGSALLLFPYQHCWSNI